MTKNDLIDLGFEPMMWPTDVSRAEAAWSARMAIVAFVTAPLPGSVKR